jgi:hypothetical protein
MGNMQFSRREVDRSFRKFKDIISDLSQSQWQTWEGTFRNLLTHCQQDPVMRLVMDPLLTNTNVDATKWYTDARNSTGGMLGRGTYDLPYDDEDRTALLYQFFIMINDGRADFSSFCISVYGEDSFQSEVHVFNRELVDKFAREVSYRLDEIIEDIGAQQEVPREAMMVFHHHDNSMNVYGNIQGSNLAAAGSTISGSEASYTTNEELASALKALRPMVQDLAEGHREIVGKALHVLIEATHDASISREQVAEATGTIAAAAPTLAQKLKEIGGKISISVASAAIVQGLKMAILGGADGG